MVTAAFLVIISMAEADGDPTRGSLRSPDLEDRVRRLEREVRDVKRDGGLAGSIVFLFACFCALWAQNTGRNAWLWFFLGLFFHVITVLFLLAFNAQDRRSRATSTP